MKKIKKVIKFSVFTMIVVLFTIVIGNILSPKVNAANGKINVSFTVVDYDKYVYFVEKKNYLETDMAKYITKGEPADGCDFTYFWNNPDDLQNEDDYFGYTDANTLWDATSGRNTIKSSANSSVMAKRYWSGLGYGEYPDQIIKALKAEELAAHKSEFTPSTETTTNYFGVVYTAQCSTRLATIQFGVDYKNAPSSVSGAGPLSNNTSTVADYAHMDVSIAPDGKDNFIMAGAADGVVTVGAQANDFDTGADYSSAVSIKVLRVPISKTANGTYSLTLKSGSTAKGTYLGSVAFDKTAFISNTATITVQGASSDTTTTFYTGTSATSVTTPASTPEDHTNHTAKMATVAANHSTVYLTGTVAASGKMPASVKYATTQAGLATGTTKTETSTGSGIYAIPMDCDTTKSMWVSVTVTASDNNKQDTYTIEIPRGKYDIAELTGLSLDIGGNAVSLYASSTATTATTFSSTTKTYYIRLKNSETSINIKPKWNTDYNETCKVITSTSSAGTPHATSDSSAPYTHSGTGDIKVRIISESETPVDYVIHVYRFSDDATMSYFKYGTSSTNISTAASGTGTNLTGTAVKGTTAIWFKFKPTNAKATMEYSFEDTTTPGSFTSYTSEAGVQCTFTNGTGAATMYIHVKVTSESGESEKEYILTIVRDAGSKETGIDGIKVSYNGSTTYDTAVKQSDNITYIVTNKYTFTGLTTDKFKFQITQKSGQVGKQIITYYKDGASDTVYNYSGTNSEYPYDSAP